MRVALFAAMLAAAGVSPPAATVLKPTGKWVVEYDPTMCILQRDYGDGDAKITLGFRPWPMGSDTELVVMAPWGRGSTKETGKGHAALEPSGQSTTGDFYRYHLTKTQSQLVTMNASLYDLHDLNDATALTISFAGASATQFSLPGFAAANRALDACQDDLLKGWGIDPAERQIVAQGGEEAKGDAAQWITNDDYPTDAVRNHIQGTTTMIWAISETGHVHDCRIVGSSGSKDLDEAACGAISRRARYTPAHDKNGKPVPWHSTRRVVWRLPL